LSEAETPDAYYINIPLGPALTIFFAMVSVWYDVWGRLNIYGTALLVLALIVLFFSSTIIIKGVAKLGEYE